MNEIKEIKLPEGVESIAVTQHDNKIVIEFIPEKSKFKEGDFVYEDGRIMIVKNYPDNYYALIYPKLDMKPVYNGRYAPTMPLSSLSFRYTTEEEKQLLIDAMEKDGKRWNAEKLIVEDIPKPKFKVGDSVKIKEGISSITHRHAPHSFIEDMDKYIGKKLIVEHAFDDVHCGIHYIMTNDVYYYAEDWLEPYTEELKKGDLAIFWDNDDNECSLIRIYDRKDNRGYYDSRGTLWDSAIKFESKEQFEKVLRGEI